jgi:DNA-binding winged helix-turn-helix (wHTH) protein
LNPLPTEGGTATVAYKDRLNLQHRQGKTWLPQQDQRAVLEPNQNVEMGLLPECTTEIESLPAFDDHRLHFQALREILESDTYQVALIPRDKWDLLRGSRAEPFSTAPPTVLIPFRWKQLAARGWEFVWDSNTSAESRIARFEDVCVDFVKMEVSRSGESIALTIQEFKTLKCFLLNPYRVFSRSQLLNEAWGYENYPSTRTVDSHVYKLRQKLERDPGRPIHFRTVHGAGYKFVP